MKIAVLGAGVIGVTSAYYLTKAGHELIVVDRQPGPGMETSFANAGEISPGYASPWASPDIPRKVVQWLFMKHSPLILRPKPDPDMLRWLIASWRNCTHLRYAVNKARMMRLAEFSRERLVDLENKTGIQYDQRARGTLQIFRSQRQLDSISKDLGALRAANVPYEIMNRERCVAIEPGLRMASASITGGLHLPNDQTGDCFQFTTKLAALCVASGVAFKMNARIDQLTLEGNRVVAAVTDQGVISADAFILALGSHSSRFVRGLGIRLPVYPVKGYSITLPITDEARAPQSTLMDETYKVAITRLGNRIRVGGMAEICGFSGALHPKRRVTLEQCLEGLFPGAGNLEAGSFWSGLRPMTPDGTPIIGATPIENLFLNTGHGTLGWTMACGSAHVLADIISCKSPSIDTSDLSIARYA